MINFPGKEKYGVDDLRAVVEILRGPEGCPWDRVQDHVSLRRELLEETAETVEAIDRADSDMLLEELGDVLLQVVIQSEFAERYGWFNFDDVVQGVADKMIRRHPHVFTEEQFDSVDAIRERWYAIKAKEKEEKKKQPK
jgi:tetrapyrrole methylase family protein/MazG family protein